MARDKDSYDFMPSIVAVMERPPVLHTRIISALVILLILIAGYWTFASRVDIIVSAQGEIVPAGRVKVIQAADQGVVRRILVGDGQIVEEGTALIELDGTSIKAEETRLAIQRGRVMLTVQRLRAELGESVKIGAGIDLPPPAIETEKGLYTANTGFFLETVSQLEHKLDEASAAREVTRRQVDKLRTRIDHLEARLTKKREQAKVGLIPGQEVEDTEFELRAARKELAIYEEKLQETAIRITAARERIRSARVERESGLYEALAQAEHELKSIEQDLVKARQRSAYQVLRAPVSGMVQQLSVHTIGAVVQRGERLLVIVPTEAGLQMDARILNKDIGFVDTDQPARVKVDAFEFTRYGHLEGRLQWVGSDAVVDEEKGPVYPARISLASMSMQNRVGGRDAAVVPGMRATADIVVGERRLIEYFVAPLLRYRDESLRER
jgi:hemolysin D